MTPHPDQALSDWLLASADDEMVLAHRDSEWTGHAPILEEDIAFANLALDEMGHASLWFGALAELRGEDRAEYTDRLVFFRSAQEFRNIQMVELPRGDWAFSMVRQYLFDEAELLRLARLAHSQSEPIAQIAVKVQKEEIYHVRHTHAWIRRLGLGTEESRQRCQAALDELWPFAQQLFSTEEGAKVLVRDGIVPDPTEVRLAWEGVVGKNLTESGLMAPTAHEGVPLRRDEHTPHLTSLLAEMQSVARTEPSAVW